MSSLVSWDPFGNWMTPLRAGNRLRPGRALRALAKEGLCSFLSLDMFETDDDIVVKATLPGVKPDDIKITALGNTVTIQGETKAEEDVEEGNYIHRERRFGSFSRTVTLPQDVDADTADATFEDGVLTLSFPKPEETKAKTVQVKAK